MPRLNDAARVRWRVFAEHRARTGNGADAYRQAGFKVSNDADAAQGAYRLMQLPEVQAMCAEAERKIVRKVEAKLDDYLAQLMAAALHDSADLFDETGKPLDIPKLSATARAALVVEYRRTKNGVELTVKPRDKDKAIETLVKLLGLAKPDLPPPVAVAAGSLLNVDASDLAKMPDEDLDAVIAKLKRMAAGLMATPPTGPPEGESPA